MKRTIEDAIVLAAYAHGKKVDKQGEPYVLHPLRVMLAVSAEDRIVAVLHDVVEDSEFTLANLMAFGYSAEDIADVDALTRRKSRGETYASYIERLSASPRAVRVKIADLVDNLGRAAGLPPEDRGLKKRYVEALAFLRERAVPPKASDEKGESGGG